MSGCAHMNPEEVCASCAPKKKPCGDCGHPLFIHDTGWDAAGCMVNECSCRSYCEPKAAPVQAMSETPQEIVTRWLDEGSAVLTTPPEIRDAIRAVLDELEEYHSEGMVPANAWAYDLGRLKQAEASRDALRAVVARLQTRIKQLETGHDDWRTKAHRANQRSEQCGLYAQRIMDLEAEVARLRGLLIEWIPRHSAACCTPTPEIGTFPPGPFLPKWCRCNDLSKRSRTALEEKP